MARHLLIFGIASIALFVSPQPVRATPAITVDIPGFIGANTGSLIFPITVRGEPEDVFYGADLYLYLTGTGSQGPPSIANVDMTGPGTIFHENNLGQTSLGSDYDPPGYGVATLVLTPAGTVGPNGVLAYVTFDTTGLVPGHWYTLALTHPDLGPTVLEGLTGPDAFLLDGQFFVPLPEPATCVLAAFGAVGLLAMGYRKRSHRSK